MIVGVGIDIIEIEKFRKALERWGDGFIKRVFSDREAKERSVESLAARFAGKEAVLKAVGVGLFSVPLKRIEILGGGAERPFVVSPFDTFSFHISLSHTENFAAAVVVAEKR